jgi:hypothetical protein
MLPHAGMRSLVILVCHLLKDESASVRVQAAAAVAAAAGKLADQGADPVVVRDLNALLVAGDLNCDDLKASL